MTDKLPLETPHSSRMSSKASSATSPPARGQEMRLNLLQKLRPPPLEHTWIFWHDRHKAIAKSQVSPGASTTNYDEQLTEMHTCADVRDFWSVYNNFDVTKLPLRDSIHLFHKGVKPIWEDDRNARGGSWTFRVHKEQAEPFWKAICLLAIGGALQDAVTSSRIAFKDDICGVSFSVRFANCNIAIWNRDADHAEGIAKILQTVLDNLPPELQPKESTYYYKPHFEHRDFNSTGKVAETSDPGESQASTPG